LINKSRKSEERYKQLQIYWKYIFSNRIPE